MTTTVTTTDPRTVFAIPANVIRAAALFVSKDKTRFIPNAACLQAGADGRAELVATDCYRLAVFNAAKMNAPAEPLTFEIAPIAKMIKAAHDIVIIDTEAGTVTICDTRAFIVGDTDNALRFTAGQNGEATLPLRIVEGSYLDYDRLFPGDSAERVDHYASINPRYLADVAKAAEYILGKPGKGRLGTDCAIRMEVVADRKPIMFNVDNGRVSMRALVMPVFDYS